MKKPLLFLALLFLATIVVRGQDVQFIATAKSSVQVGEQFVIQYTINTRGSNFKAPSFAGFQLLAGPSMSSRSNIQVINGNALQSSSYTYTYYFYAEKEGKYTIEPAQIKVSDKTYTSNSLTITVTKGNATTPNNNNNAGNQGNQNNQANDNNLRSGTITDKDLFVRVSVNKSKVYQGEQIIAVIKIYTRVNLVGFEEMKFPTWKGFWAEDIETPSQVSLQQENYNGTVYNVGVIKKTILSPQQSGNLVIDPYELTVVYQEKVSRKGRSYWDEFFGTYQNVRKKLSSPAVTINVMSLPANKPAGFSGGVGTFSLEAGADRNVVKTGEAITYTLKLSGNGNLSLAELPKVNFPVDFEQYDPQLSDNISNSAAGSGGSKEAKYIIIPRHSGQYKIPGLTFSYFDINTKSYKTITTDEVLISVEKGDEDSSLSVVNGVDREDVQFVGKDIRFIRTGETSLKRKDTFLIYNLLFLSLFPLALALFMAVVIFRRKYIKRSSDLVMVKNRKARKLAGLRLKNAKKHLDMNDSQRFYEEVSRALWDYLADKLMIPRASLSRETVVEPLAALEGGEELTAKMTRILDTCEFARYAPSGSLAPMSEIYAEAVSFISEIEQNLR